VNEKEWLEGTDPQKMLKFLRRKPAGRGHLSCTCCRVRCRQQVVFCPAYRKLRLFACACCHRILHLLPDPVCQRTLQALENYIEGVADTFSYMASTEKFDKVRRDSCPKMTIVDVRAWNALYCAVHRRWLEYFDDNYAEDRWWIAMGITQDAWSGSRANENRVQSNMLRDIFGNPFHPTTLDPAWLTPTVKALAQAIYTDRTFEAMPVMGDALEEAGCTNEDVLSHCRGPGLHTRGCWALDLVLGKT
jgi:hypothetical protein